MLVRNLICPGATDLEFQGCIADARHRRLDPIKKQIWFIPRWNSQAENADGTFGRKVWVSQVSIDGLRHISARDHRDYGTEDEPEFGPLKTVTWTYTYKGKQYTKSIQAPESATVRVWKKGADRPTVATVWWDEIYPDIANAPLVKRMPRLMLGKCASAQAHRKAYPETGGLYIPEEFYGNRPEFSPAGRHLAYPEEHGIPSQIEAEVERQKTGSVPSPRNAIRGDMSAPAAPKPPSTPAPAAPAPAKEYVGTVTLDWTEDESSPILRGDIANLTALLEKHCHMTWRGDWWHVEPRDRETIKQMCEQCGPYQFVEVLPKAEKPSGGISGATARSAPLSPPENPAATRGSARPSGASAPAAELLKCKIERSIAGMVDKTPVRDVTVLTSDKKKPTYRCWDKKYFEAFDQAIGQEALLVLKRNKGYTNIERPIRIGAKTWDEHGVPELQKDREPGQKSLYP